LNVARKALAETVTLVGDVVASPAHLRRKPLSAPLQHHVDRVLAQNGSASHTHKIYDYMLQRTTEAAATLPARAERITAGHPVEVHALAEFIDIDGAYPAIRREDLVKLLAPALGDAPPEHARTERLVRHGRLFLETLCQAHVLALPSRNVAEVTGALDFSRARVGNYDALYADRELLTEFLKRNGFYASVVLPRDVRWERTRLAQAERTLHAVVGLLLKVYGSLTTEKFVKAKIIGGYNGLMSLMVDR
jgi:hypothetical protein